MCARKRKRLGILEAMKESSTYQAIVEEGRVEGRVEGAIEDGSQNLVDVRQPNPGLGQLRHLGCNCQD
jgi:predicted transposase YdaD